MPLKVRAPMQDFVTQPLLPDRLKTLWEDPDGPGSDERYARQQEETATYAAIWAEALRLPEETDLTRSLCRELARLTDCDDLEKVRQRCQGAMREMKADWETTVRDGDADSVVTYYDQSTAYAYELMWWHTLEEDDSPLAYVCALHLALKSGCRKALDFGAGVGSGALLFHHYGFEVTLADISSTLLDFSRRRLDARGVPASPIDLKTTALPEAGYDFITAMDVFEHIAEPEETVTTLAAALQPGGILFGRFSADIDPDRPSHIAQDFAPTFRRLKDLGFTECWRDQWLWGHQAFRKN